MAAKNAEPSDFVKLGSALGGILLAIIVLFMLFAKEMMLTVLPTIVWAFVVLGIVLGSLQYKSQKK
ncbi:hypothetical protein KY347_00990 [Candidatus Woesearchaeota archaeon]|nr:hypothetical protein [Candidatus Woesearchaeota archaeon]